MNYQDFTNQFKSQVNTISRERKIALVKSVCKKLIPYYKSFFDEYNWGNPDVLTDAINLIENEPHDINEIKKMLLDIDEVTPDTDNFQNGSFALNACTAIYETLQFLIDNDTTHIINVGSYLTDTIDFKIQEIEELEEEEIDNHPLMKETREYLLAESKS
jgi:uncharacterized protein YjaG (DUF416 family)